MVVLLVTMMMSLIACAEMAPALGAPESAVVDDFDGPAGSRPDARLWNYDIGPSAVHGWEAGSVQTYTDSPDNVRLDGQGNLVIEARMSDGGFTSGRLVTLGKLSMTHGRMSARIKMPSGRGLWPAFWLVGVQNQWPYSGEIDVVELPGGAANYYTTVHGPVSGTDSTQQAQFSGPDDDLSADFHEYWVQRDPERVTVGLDQRTIGVFTPASLHPGSQWVLDQPMYALLNVAVGGEWPGFPDESTRFPATMLVDWFRFEPTG